MSSHYKGKETTQLVKYDEVKDITTIKPLALSIIWAGDPRYWNLNHEKGTAELLQVSWLEVSGQVSMPSFQNKAGKEYVMRFRVELKPDNFGWGDGPIYLMVKPGNDRRSWRRADLSTKNPGEIFDVPIDRILKFKVPDTWGPNDKLEIGMYEIWRGRWKGGLVIHEVVIAPVPQAQ